jgi:hypothetical protein
MMVYEAATMHRMKKSKVGIITAPPGVFMHRHEKLAVDYLAQKLGYDITFVVPDRHIHRKTADIKMIGKFWEIKSPTGKSNRTIENNLRLAIKQSKNIVLDLRRMDGRVPAKKHLTEIQKQFDLSKAIKHLLIITRQEEVIEHKR